MPLFYVMNPLPSGWGSFWLFAFINTTAKSILRFYSQDWNCQVEGLKLSAVMDTLLLNHFPQRVTLVIQRGRWKQIFS